MQNEATETATIAAWAEINELVATTSGISVAATGRHEPGIGRVDFLLVDLTKDAFASVVDRKDVDYSVPPTGVGEAWSSNVPLAAESSYRLFFHVYDRSGVNLVAYDRRDFTVPRKGES